MFQKRDDYVDEISEALGSINGTLGTVKIANVYDAAQIARAVAEVEHVIDGRLSQHLNNPFVAQLAAKMKAGYRQKMLEAVNAKKAALSGHGSPGLPPLLPPCPALPSLAGPSARPPGFTGFPGMHGRSFGTPFLRWPPARTRIRRP